MCLYQLKKKTNSRTNLSQAKGCQRHDTILGYQCNHHSFGLQYVMLGIGAQMSVWQQRPSISLKSSENALNSWMPPAVTLISDMSMMQPSETIMMVREVTKMIVIALFKPGGMTGL